MKHQTLMCAALALITGSAAGNIAAGQVTTLPQPNGTYGFVAAAQQLDSQGDNGGAIVGLITFDGSGGATGTATVKPRNNNANNAKAFTAPLSGTYTGNPDGTVTLNISFAGLFSLKMAVAPIDGSGFNLLGLDCAPCGVDVGLVPKDQTLGLLVKDQTISGRLPMGPFLPGAAGAIPLTLANVTNDANGPSSLVYAVNGVVGSGPATCPDGSSGTWNATIPTVTAVMSGGGGNIRSGNFLLSLVGTVCGGDPNAVNVSGLVYTNIIGVDLNYTLHAVFGDVVKGVARAAGGSSLSGFFGYKIDFQPYPIGSVGIMNFDGAGNVTVSQTNAGNTGAPATVQFTGTYTINPDSTGTITLKNVTGAAGPTLTIVLTDGGSQFLMLRTDSNPGFDVAYGSANLLPQ